MKILLLTGYRKTGKTTCADIVCKLDPRFKKVSFADVLKDAYAKQAKIDRKLLDDVFEKEKHREGITQLGDKERTKDRYVFAVGLRNRLNPDGFYVVDDTRRIEELEVMLKIGAVPYGVYAEDKVRFARGWKYNPAVDEHMSETELGGLSAYTWHCLGGGQINNNGSLERTKDQVIEILRSKFPFTIEDLTLLGKVK